MNNHSTPLGIITTKLNGTDKEKCKVFISTTTQNLSLFLTKSIIKDEAHNYFTNEYYEWECTLVVVLHYHIPRNMTQIKTDVKNFKNRYCINTCIEISINVSYISIIMKWIFTGN